jgi:flagellar biosynthetic protein FliR
LPQITQEQVETFIFVLLRVIGIVTTMPILGTRNVPVRVKGGLSLLIAFLVLPSVTLAVPPVDILPLALAMTGEVLIGVLIGFAGSMIFSGIQLAGQLVGFQMGFSVANVYDPISSAQVSIMAQFLNLVAILIFFGVNGHHVFIYGIAESYRIVAPLDFHFSGELTRQVVVLSKDIFIIGIKTGAPVIAMLLMISIGFGLIARTVPQVNILIAGFPIKIGVGLIGMGLTLPAFALMMGDIFVKFGNKLKLLLYLM